MFVYQHGGFKMTTRIRMIRLFMKWKMDACVCSKH